MHEGELLLTYRPSESRYNEMIYNYCGKSGLKLPAVSLGLFRSFSKADGYDNPRELIQTAFDHGITHFDIANNYGDGNAEEVFGKILKQDFLGFRDEMIISTKAGYYMWSGPYGDWGSRKYMISSLDQSLKRLNLDYVDIYYSHRHDPNTPLEETAGALDAVVKQGKALYVGISNYPAKETKEMAKLFKELRTPFIIHQPQYSMFIREPEKELFPVLEDEGIGAIVFQPLYQGLLTSKYVEGIPDDSRVAKKVEHFSSDDVTKERVAIVRKLMKIAEARNQTMAQLAIAWTLQQKSVVSALIGASKKDQLIENIGAINHLSFTEEELKAIDHILTGAE